MSERNPAHIQKLFPFMLPPDESKAYVESVKILCDSVVVSGGRKSV